MNAPAPPPPAPDTPARPALRALACPRCGGDFRCGAAGPGPCACTGLTLTPALQAALRARWDDCLCLDCLRALADGAPLAAGAPLTPAASTSAAASERPDPAVTPAATASPTGR